MQALTSLASHGTGLGRCGRRQSQHRNDRAPERERQPYSYDIAVRSSAVLRVFGRNLPVDQRNFFFFPLCSYPTPVSHPKSPVAGPRARRLRRRCSPFGRSVQGICKFTLSADLSGVEAHFLPLASSQQPCPPQPGPHQGNQKKWMCRRAGEKDSGGMQRDRCRQKPSKYYDMDWA